MAKKSKRRIKKNIVSQIEQTFDLQRLDYATRTKPIRNKAKLVGALVAGILYIVMFAVGYIGMQKGIISFENFAKMVWILMIPTTVVGSFAWLLTTNRKEYTVREDVQQYIQQLEGDGGLLWRYAPIMSELNPNDLEFKKTCVLSKQGKVKEMVPEDYAKAIQGLYTTVMASGSRRISPETEEELGSNLSN